MTQTRPSPIRVLIVDDHLVVREGLISLLESAKEIEIVGQAENGPTALSRTRALNPDVVLLDIRMPGSSGLDICRTLQMQSPKSRVIILTTYEEEDYLFRALGSGAWGYVLKTASYDELVNAIMSVASGHRLLSAPMVDKLIEHFGELAREKARLESGFAQSELDIIRLLAEGATNREIADRLHWSEVSVKRKLQSIFEKLDVQDRTSAAIEAMRRGLI
jgi:NarL family two-component system response regulator LiaR